MTSKEAETCKHSANTCDFWQEITRQFEPEYYNEPMFVLSPKQTRILKMAYMGVPKFQHTLDRMTLGHRFYPIDKNMFERNLFEWDAMGFIKHDDLEEPYALKLKRPDFIQSLPQWDNHINILRRFIQNKELSSEFAKLWAAYIQRVRLIDYLEIFDPYKASSKAIAARKSKYSVVQKYIYALWMQNYRYDGTKGERDRLATKLAGKLDDLIEADQYNDLWYLKYCKSMLKASENNNIPMNRTVTDMTVEDIKEYAEDGAFTRDDFRELFSEP